MPQSIIQQINVASIAVMKFAKRIALFKEADYVILRRFSRNFSISFAGAVSFVIIGLGRTALLTKSLEISDYGKVLIVLNLFSFLGAFLSVRVHDVIYRFYPQFEQEKDIGALRGLLFLCFALSLTQGLIVGGGVFVLAPWIGDRIYNDAELTFLLRIYSIPVVVLAICNVSSAILRVYDRFHYVIIPQVLGGVTTLTLLAVYFYSADTYRLEPIVGAFALGLVVQNLPPFILMLRIVKPYIFTAQTEGLLQALSQHRPKLVCTLFHANLSGYLRLAFSPGDVFLLGIFSTPTHVAIYGLARSLTSPLTMLQNNIQTAITPEVVSLFAKGKVEQLKRLVKGHVVSTFIIGTLAGIAFLFLSRPLIIWISKPEYLDALPIVYALLGVIWITFIFLIFYPIGLCLDMLKWFNLSNVVNILVLLTVLTFTMSLTALTMAYIQLAAAIIRRFLANTLVAHRLFIKMAPQQNIC